MELYVSTVGNDSNDGTKTSPLKTIEKAFEKITDGGKVILFGGEYRCRAELKDKENITIEPHNGEKVAITGAVKVNYSDFTAVGNEELKNIMPKNVSELDLNKFGIKADKLCTRGFRRPYVAANNELIADGNAARLSAYPKSGMIKIGEVLDTGSISQDVPNPDYSNRGGIFKYDDERISEWKFKNELMAFGYFSCNFADDTLPVKNIDTENKTVELGKSVMFGVKSGHTSYKFLNVLEELKEPGEYCLDAANNKIYYVPHSGINENTEIYLTDETEPLISFINTKNVTLKNINIRNSRGLGVYIEQGDGNTIENCTFSNLGILAVCIGKGVESDREYHHHAYKGKAVSKALGSWHEHIYNDVMFDRDAGKNHTVRNCLIYGCGAGGISMGGGSRRTLEPANNKIEHCVIHDCNRLDKSYKALINIDGVGNIISDCELYNATNMAVYMHGNRHILQYCDIHDCCTEADDAGAFYIGRDPSERENVVRYNYFHDIHVPHKPKIPITDGMGAFAIYNDDSTCDVTIYGNIFHRAGTWAIHNNCCKDMVIENNIFSECQAAVVHGDAIWKNPSYIDENSTIYDRLMNQVKIFEPPYSTEYPELATYFEDKGKPVRNVFANNIIYKCLNGLQLRHREEWYINDEYIESEHTDFRDKIHEYDGWYEEYGNYVMNKTIENADDPKTFFGDEITRKTVGFKPFDVDRILRKKLVNENDK